MGHSHKPGGCDQCIGKGAAALLERGLFDRLSAKEHPGAVQDL